MFLEEYKTLFADFLLKREPFIFVIDFEKNKPFICKLKDASANSIYYNIKGVKNYQEKIVEKKPLIQSHPIHEKLFAQKLEKVKEQLNLGNTYLLNLTFKTKIEVNLDLSEIFYLAESPYKIFFKDQFVSFSPECFIQTNNNQIFTFPMKGTIDATEEEAEKKLLENKKEEWEHNTIVDLLRNDLSMISKNITVEKYRYIDKIQTNRSEILQTSSIVKGNLSASWTETFADDMFALLPAGSISGAPKIKTVELIKEIEGEERGYYTGVFGIFDGENFDSAVTIRYIEKIDNDFYYRSGGGITSNSDVLDEYNELLQKIYIPLLKRGD